MVSVLRNKTFWAAIVAVVVILVQAFVPAFAPDQTIMTDMIVILAAYAVSMAIDPGNRKAFFLEMIRSRRFWFTVVSLFVLVMAALRPYTIDVDALTGYIVVVSTMVVSLAVDPGSAANKWLALIRSRKFWSALVGMVTTLLYSFGLQLPLGFSTEQIINIAYAASAYIAGTAIQRFTLPAPVTPTD